jgi:uncharacterized protein YukE
MEQEEIPAKKITRRKRSDSTSNAVDVSPKLLGDESAFEALVKEIKETQGSFNDLQKQIARIQDSWAKEQKDHETQIAERDLQEEVAKKRRKETYEYEENLERKKAEDAFSQKKLIWERDLESKKEALESEKKELENLRKNVALFDAEKEKAIKEACSSLQKELVQKWEFEKKLSDQETKSEKEMLNLRISSLTEENKRLNSEIDILKKSLQTATDQIKQIAVKVIESGSQKTIDNKGVSE